MWLAFETLYPGVALRPKLNKICSLIPLTIESSTQSHSRRTLSIVVVITGVSDA